MMTASLIPFTTLDTCAVYHDVRFVPKQAERLRVCDDSRSFAGVELTFTLFAAKWIDREEEYKL